MTPEQLNDVTLKFWELSRQRNGHVEPGRALNVSEANHLIGDELDHLDPNRKVARRFEYLRHYIIIGERPECPPTSSVSTLNMKQ